MAAPGGPVLRGRDRAQPRQRHQPGGPTDHDRRTHRGSGHVLAGTWLGNAQRLGGVGLEPGINVGYTRDDDLTERLALREIGAAGAAMGVRFGRGLTAPLAAPLALI